MGQRILIVDDHGVLRAGLASLLSSEPAIEIIGEADSGEMALRMVAEHKPDILLMDISMPGLDGIETTRRITTNFPGVRVLILTLHEDRAMLVESLRAGASGYILKRALKNELLNAIDAVSKGDIYIHPAMTRVLLAEPLTPAPKKPEQEALTQREIEVLRLIVKGYTNGQAASQLNVSVRTVEYHRANLMGKLNITSRVELMRYAEENNLL